MVSDKDSRIVDYYTDVVLPALAERLDTVFPEFGWRRDGRGWTATNEEMTHRVLGVRAERVVAHGPAPRGFLVHGADPVLWTAYVNGGQVPRGADFVRTVETLAERVGVDTAPLEPRQPRDRRSELLEMFFELAQAELVSERGAAARAYLESRGLPAGTARDWGLGVVPGGAADEFARAGFTAQEIETSGLTADRRWHGRICGAWRSERGTVRTVWARAVGDADQRDSKYLYLRGSRRNGLPPYGLSEVLRLPLTERRDLVLVEGLLDVHHLRSRGVVNVAAFGGTAADAVTFERLARLGIERVTLCLDRDGPGRTAAARAVDRAVRATASPTLLVLDPKHLDPAKDPDAFVRARGVDAWLEVLGKRECAIQWRARELVGAVTLGSLPLSRRDALARAGAWLGSLPARYALEQEDAVRAVADRCGYSREAVDRAFRSRYWSGRAHSPECGRERHDVGRDL
jgi:DNA primase